MIAQASPPSQDLAPLARAWIGKIKAAKERKQRFDDVSKQCTAFFSGSCGFMWQQDFLQKFIGISYTPTFKVTIAKAFELVAIFGPTLYWRNPIRVVKPRKQIGLTPDLFGIPGDPVAQQVFEMAQFQQSRRSGVDKAVSAMLEQWLNYTPIEQPGGGLQGHASMAITEALIKGRGCLWPKPYMMPSSNRVLTGCFYDTVDNLLIDPDATNVHEAQWIAQKVVAPTWQAERELNLAAGTLQGYAHSESGNRQGEGDSFNSNASMDRTVGKTFDLITYYRIWSKGGVGGRLSGEIRSANPVVNSIENAIGDFAYIVVAENVPFPLNAPPQTIYMGADGGLHQDTARQFQWPIPYYLDNRWPVALLDFYNVPNDPWALAPMAPGLGELTFLNFAYSALMNRVWWTSRVLMALSGDVEAEHEMTLKSGGDFSTMRLKSWQGKDINQMLSFVDFPETKMDYWQTIDRVSLAFDKRTGLSDLLYAMNPGGSVDRSAEDSANKKMFASIRPEYMAGRVESFMDVSANMEKLCCRWFVESQDLSGLFGPVEQYLWQQYVMNESPEHVVRELRATVVANSARKPDKQRDVENVNQGMQLWLPMLQQYFFGTGDPRQINTLMQMWGSAIDQDVSGLLMQPPQPQPDPMAQQMAQMQFEQMMNEVASQQQQMQMSSQEHMQRMNINAEQHQQKMVSAAVSDWVKTEQLKQREQMAKSRATAAA